MKNCDVTVHKTSKIIYVQKIYLRHIKTLTFDRKIVLYIDIVNMYQYLALNRKLFLELLLLYPKHLLFLQILLSI